MYHMTKGSNANVINGNLTDQKIYRVNSISYDKTTQKTKVTLKELSQVMTGGLSHDPGDHKLLFLLLVQIQHSLVIHL